MNESVNKKIQVLLQKAKEEEKKPKREAEEQKESNIPNSLADQIKTQEQAKSFLTLLSAL